MLTLARSGVLFFAGFIAFAQTGGGTLTGVVSDPTGAVVPNASIQVKNSETGAIFQGGTSATGNYTFQLPRGTYELSISDDRTLGRKARSGHDVRSSHGERGDATPQNRERRCQP